MIMPVETEHFRF